MSAYKKIRVTIESVTSIREIEIDEPRDATVAAVLRALDKDGAARVQGSARRTSR